MAASAPGWAATGPRICLATCDGRSSGMAMSPTSPTSPPQRTSSASAGPARAGGRDCRPAKRQAAGGPNRRGLTQTPADCRARVLQLVPCHMDLAGLPRTARPCLTDMKTHPPAYRLVRCGMPPASPPRLDADQLRVVSHAGGPLLVLAGPGTGKTTAIVAAVADRIARRGIDPGRVLVLTFSRKAAQELRERITLQLGR